MPLLLLKVKRYKRGPKTYLEEHPGHFFNTEHTYSVLKNTDHCIVSCYATSYTRTCQIIEKMNQIQCKLG
jgi:hypothetical protein